MEPVYGITDDFWSLSICASTYLLKLRIAIPGLTLEAETEAKTKAVCKSGRLTESRLRRGLSCCKERRTVPCELAGSVGRNAVLLDGSGKLGPISIRSSDERSNHIESESTSNQAFRTG
jgi:hypothetical protein